MTYLQLAYWHLATVVPAFLLATFLLFMPKGTGLHKLIGKFVMLMVLVTAIITLFMPATLGPSLYGHFGFIHIISVFVIYSIITAYVAAKRGDIKAHKAKLVGIYIGGFFVAGALAFMPERLLHGLLFG